MKTIRAGSLTSLIVFEERTVTTSTSSTSIGAPVESWSTWGRAWAEVLDGSGKEQFTEARETAIRSMKVRIRYTPGTSPLIARAGVDTPGEIRMIYPYSTDNSGPRWDIEDAVDEGGRNHSIVVSASRRQ